MTAESIFPQLVHRVHYPKWNYAKIIPICEGLVRGARENSHLEVGNAQSSVMNTDAMPHTLAVFKPFYDWLHPQIERVLFDDWHFEPNVAYFINDSWVNRHGPGGETTAHTHGVAAMAISAYLQVPDQSGDIEFMDPNERMWRMFFRSHQPGQWTPLKVAQGDVLMFPGWLDHRTQPNLNHLGRDRWVLTTNIFCHKPMLAR